MSVDGDALLKAVNEKNISSVKTLLSQGVDINYFKVENNETIAFSFIYRVKRITVVVEHF
jgi:hypothetical protein